MKILVTGGTGFIGSHTVVELINSGYDVVIADNLYNSKEMVVDRIEQITGKRPVFYKLDVLDREGLDKLFAKEGIEAVIHFAGYKAVGESTQKPIEYYHNNLESTLALADVMRKYGCKKFVFSSSATVYGDPAFVPITEECPLGETTNPYGTTKAMQERILTDIWKSDSEWRIMLLRYFNPIGAHESGLIGEDPKGIPNNLLPYVAQVATGKLEKIHVFGNDYDTPDGTGVRDYIHVVDLAKGHVKAIEGMEKLEGVNIFNLGTGTGYSVLDIIKAFNKACRKELPYVIDPRRPGDIAQCYSDPEKAFKVLGWKAEKTLDDMCTDSWNWQSKNPDG
ncbi:MAG: UDP-glucose 4-epimerase GalE, partial [Lachnospiraceae bacterium]|nr:UDP-glucose 4-epimerase GalE [Lachnospiraceae bacterium]